MEIAEELQHAAAERAGSPEGFQEVIRLVLDQFGEEAQLPPLPFAPPSLALEPEWAWPETYLPVFREFVELMQEALHYQKYVYRLEEQRRYDVRYIPDEFREAQKELSNRIHAAKKKKRELPIHAYKRLLAVEERNASRWGGKDNLYLPHNWSAMSRLVEAYISNFGVGREEQKASKRNLWDRDSTLPAHDKEVSYGEARYGDC